MQWLKAECNGKSLMQRKKPNSIEQAICKGRMLNAMEKSRMQWEKPNAMEKPNTMEKAEYNGKSQMQ